MKIVVVGTRGIPDIQGGVETHCENLYPRLAAMGHDVTVIRRSCYVKENNRLHEYRGVKLVDVYAPKKKSLEAIVHTTLAVLKAATMHPDVIHFHAVGPSLLIPLARLLGMKVVMTNHGPDYDRKKWGRAAKAVLKGGERAGTMFGNRIIVISQVIADILRTHYGREKGVVLIPNGVDTPVRAADDSYIQSIGAEPGRYIVALGRFVEEKGFHDLINAYVALGRSDVKLVIAGDADHEDDYSLRLKEMARENGVILTGFIKGERLNQVMSHAALFVLPSYHEGLPIALLEAMSYGLDVAVSDIPANRIPELDEKDFFRAGDVDALARLLDRKLAVTGRREYDLSRYDWDNIAQSTSRLYKELMS